MPHTTFDYGFERKILAAVQELIHSRTGSGETCLVVLDGDGDVKSLLTSRHRKVGRSPRTSSGQKVGTTSSSTHSTPPTARGLTGSESIDRPWNASWEGHSTNRILFPSGV